MEAVHNVGRETPDAMPPLRPDHDWTRVYCDTQAEADRLAADLVFMAPLVAAAFSRAVGSRRGSCVVAEFVPSDAYHSTYVTARTSEMPGWVERCVAALAAREDFEECAALAAVGRAVARDAHARETERADS